MHGIRKKITQTEKNHWSLGERNTEKTHLEEVEEESHGCAGGGGRVRERENWVLCVEDFYPFSEVGGLGEVPEKNLIIIFINFPSVSFQGWRQGRDSLVIAAGPDVNHSITPLGFACFTGLGAETQLKPTCYI